MLNETNIPLEEDGIEEEILVDEEVAITKAMWGDIGGNIENQADLKNALDAKQDSLTETQLNAVNSGITTEKVTTYDGYADQIASKANQSALNAEATTREQADTALGKRIDDEATARQNADNGLQSQIDAITSKSDVVDVVANYAALQAYDTSTLGNNDVIKVLDDETHEDALTYYRWSTTTQTWSFIGQEAPYYSKGQMDVMLQGKQDKLTAGANIQIQNGTISATDTTYTAGNGLNLNGTEFSADTDILATKEDLESYYTKPETDNLLAPKLEAEVVAELPTTGEEGKLYLTPKAHTTQTATGNPITATVAEEAGALESFQLDGDTFQQSYEGKNLYNATTAETTTRGLTFSGDTGFIYLNGTKTVDEPVNWANGSLPAGTYKLMLQLVGGSITSTSNGGLFYLYGRNITISPSQIVLSSSNPKGSITLTVSESTTNAHLDLWARKTETYNNAVIRYQIVRGTADDYDFEPYVGGQASPNPNYPQPIQTVTGEQTVEIQGKNLFDYTTLAEGTYNGVTASYDSQNQAIVLNGTCTTNNTAIPFNIAPFSVSGNQAISYEVIGGTISNATADTMVLLFQANYASSINVQLAQTDGSASFTRSGEYIMARIRADNGVVFKNYKIRVQLELSATATSFAPYSKQTLPLDLGTIELCKLGDYQDYIWKDGEDWKVHKATASYQITGQESDLQINTSQTNTARFFSNTALSATGAAPGGNSALILCNRLERDTTIWSTDVVGIYVNQAAIVGRMDKTVIGTTVEEARNYFANNPTLICYQLATPTDTVITDTALIAQLEAIRTASLENGANTITNTATGSNLAGDMEIGYYGYNPTNRYDKFIWLDINDNYEQIGS